MHRIIAAIAAAFVTTTLGAELPVPATDQPALQCAINRGTLLYAYDQAAWHGTDALRAEAADKLPSVGGWIVDGPVTAPEIIFFDKDTTEPHALFIADLRKNKVIASHVVTDPQEAALSPLRKRMIVARQNAARVIAAAKAAPCTAAPFNTIIVPPSGADDMIAVYFLSAQTDAKIFPLGGHYAIQIGVDGMPKAARPFSKTCLNTPSAPPQGQPVAMVVSHILDPVPTELHVFTALTTQRPLYVITAHGTWAINPNDGAPRITLAKAAAPSQ